MEKANKFMSEGYALLFGIPPEEERPQSSWFTRGFISRGYTPHIVEAYVYYKTFLFTCWFVASLMFLYAVPFLLRGTIYEGFHIFPDAPFNGYIAFPSREHFLPELPYDYFRYQLPRQMTIPLIGVSCLYAFILSLLNRKKHQWCFSNGQDYFLVNTRRIRKKWLGMMRLVIAYVATCFIGLLVLYSPSVLLAVWDSFDVLNQVHSFSEQTWINMILVGFNNLFLLSIATVNIFVHIFVLLLECLLCPSSPFLRAFSKGE